MCLLCVLFRSPLAQRVLDLLSNFYTGDVGAICPGPDHGVIACTGATSGRHGIIPVAHHDDLHIDRWIARVKFNPVLCSQGMASLGTGRVPVTLPGWPPGVWRVMYRKGDDGR